MLENHPDIVYYGDDSATNYIWQNPLPTARSPHPPARNDTLDYVTTTRRKEQEKKRIIHLVDTKGLPGLAYHGVAIVSH
jgi:hypothetical protein